MSTEKCKLCDTDCTPWFHINGHICQDCYLNSKEDKMENERVIENLEINIGQDAFRMCPVQMMIRLNDHVFTCELKEFKSWIDDIYNSNGDRGEKAYKAKKNLDCFFATLLQPFRILPKAPE